MIRALLPAVLATVLLPAMAVSAQAGGVLTIDVGNIRAAKGLVRVDVCPEAKFVKEDCPWHGTAPAQVGTTRVTVSGLPAGHYAVQAYLDENNNDKLDQNFLGIPKEGIGFSNNARITTHAPHFSDAAFDFDGAAKTIQLNLRYFF